MENLVCTLCIFLAFYHFMPDSVRDRRPVLKVGEATDIISRRLKQHIRIHEEHIPKYNVQMYVCIQCTKLFIHCQVVVLFFLKGSQIEWYHISRLHL